MVRTRAPRTRSLIGPATPQISEQATKVMRIKTCGPSGGADQATTVYLTVEMISAAESEGPRRSPAEVPWMRFSCV